MSAILNALHTSLKRIQAERARLSAGSDSQTPAALLFCKEEDIRLAIEAQLAIEAVPNGIERSCCTERIARNECGGVAE
jgi:hypothetical protein